MIPVTQPFLPPKEEYFALLESVYERNWLTNNGPLVQDLEEHLKRQLGLENLLYVSNGTIALQLAIKSLGLSGEVITTPFSYIATASSIVWEGCTPVFVDVEPNGFNLDPNNIKAAITPKTTGIVATHCFGIPCDVEAIDRIAAEHNLKVIYDGAHAFGTTVNGRSIFEFGDVSTCSFHATKMFHSIEGGMVSAKHPDDLFRMRRMRNFGHAGMDTFDGVGINAKNSEVHAAMGIVNLRYIADIAARRREQCERYDGLFQHESLQCINVDNPEWNCSYYPIVFDSEETCINVMNALEKHGISPRRYFYPSLNQVNDWSSSSCPNAESIASRILCMPLFHSLTKAQIETIVQITVGALNRYQQVG